MQAAAENALVSFYLWLKSTPTPRGYERSEETCRTVVEKVRRLHRKGLDIFNPDAVFSYIKESSYSDSYKDILSSAYAMFLRFCGRKDFRRPKWKRKGLPFILPDIEDVKLVVNSAHPRLRAALLLLRDTGMRPCELVSVKDTDFDAGKGLLLIRARKGSENRVVKLSLETVQAIAECRRFPPYSDVEILKRALRLHRLRLAERGLYVRLTLKDFRHLYATILYATTKDILAVQKALGHVNIQNTIVYIHAAQKLQPKYDVQEAETAAEARPLIEQGYDFVATSPDGKMLFRRLISPWD